MLRRRIGLPCNANYTLFSKTSKQGNGLPPRGRLLQRNTGSRTKIARSFLIDQFFYPIEKCAHPSGFHTSCVGSQSASSRSPSCSEYVRQRVNRHAVNSYAPVIPGFPQEHEASLLQVGCVSSCEGNVAHPESESQNPRPRVPRSPVIFAHSVLVGVDGVQSAQHGSQG